ncbi:MAG: hypothetical protein ACOY3K_03895 [Candidatus Omnitrophota bacterium]
MGAGTRRRKLGSLPTMTGISGLMAAPYAIRRLMEGDKAKARNG